MKKQFATGSVMTGEHFVDIVEELHPKLHGDIQYQNDFMAEGAIGNQGSPAEEETGAGKSYKGEVERAGFEDQDPTAGMAPESSGRRTRDTQGNIGGAIENPGKIRE